MLKLHDVTKNIEGFRLGPINLEIEPGFVYAIVGANGSGKSSLFRLMMGMIFPDSGAITRFGHALHTDQLDQTQRVAYVPEALTGHNDWTVNDLLSLYERTYPAFQINQANHLLAAIDRSKKFSSLSKGMQRRTMLSLALASQADLLLLDEPTDGIDPFARQDFLSEFASYLEIENRAIVIATHVLEDVRRIADYIVLMSNGQLVGTFERDALLGAWHRLWVDALPGAELPGEITRALNGNAYIVTSNVAATRAALEAAGKRVLQSGNVDPVETLSILLEQHAAATTSECDMLV